MNFKVIRLLWCYAVTFPGPGESQTVLVFGLVDAGPRAGIAGAGMLPRTLGRRPGTHLPPADHRREPLAIPWLLPRIGGAFYGQCNAGLLAVDVANAPLCE